MGNMSQIEQIMSEVRNNKFTLKNANFMSIDLMYNEVFLDVIVCSDTDLAYKVITSRHDVQGKELKTYLKKSKGFVFWQDGHGKKYNVFYVWLKSLDPVLVAHETLHILHRFCDISKCEITKAAEEWQAWFISGIMMQIQNKTNYWSFTKKDIELGRHLGILKIEEPDTEQAQSNKDE